MIINKLIFREYDIRGIADTDLNAAAVEKIAGALSAMFFEKSVKKIIIGRDGRLSSPGISSQLIDSCLACGMDVVDIGLVASPVFYFACHQMKINGGIMITGSHNPPEYNGMKISLNQATIYGEDIKAILERVEAGESPKGAEAGALVNVDIVPEYRKYIRGDISIGRKLKIVIDSGNGVGGGIIIPALREMGVEVKSLFEEVDGNFPNHFPDPTVPDNLKALIEEVKNEKADFGAAFDGDADRIGVVDEKGNIIWGDRLMALFAKSLLAKTPGGKIVFEVKCSKSLPETIEKLGGKAIMSRTGHSPIEARIQEEKALFGGEMSGHIYFNDRYFGYDDALYTVARLIELVSSSSQTLSSYLDDVPSYPITPEIRVDCADEIKFDVVDKLSTHFQRTNKVITIDGARIIFEDGWGLCRASNTGPVLVMRFEASTEEGVERIKKEVTDVLNKILAEHKKAEKKR
ncbi:phosphomannomutase/phosphoglucomutase [bacterium]|nr:phosphomannomutase/phosphoglucomutase [bacterium]MBU3955915.1 phosphomannomutase/phosphoglucomutase [bacterium]